MSEVRPPLPPFTPETAVTKVRAAEDLWTRDPERVSLAYTVEVVRARRIIPGWAISACDLNGGVFVFGIKGCAQFRHSQ